LLLLFDVQRRSLMRRQSTKLLLFIGFLPDTRIWSDVLESLFTVFVLKLLSNFDPPGLCHASDLDGTP
jgi:hypothetical protein